MLSPENVLPTQFDHYRTDKPELINLFNIMQRMELIFNEFMRIQKETVDPRNENPSNQLFSPSAQLLFDRDRMEFVNGFLAVSNIAKRTNFSDKQSIAINKNDIIYNISKCETYFFKFNQKYQADPKIMNTVAQMSLIFSEIKIELNKLELFDLPKLDLTQSVESSHSAIHRRGRESVEDAVRDDKDRYFSRKRFS